ncbi:MAG TPA: DNA repair protein RecN, partial [Gammaproteobacteria bacterium]|nr:DNA repair protein RecN [Gammaproteobacteria bacterium]
GGELSRISLAIQLEASAKTRVPTMIFDEVDSGVGGAIAEVVGKKLQSLGTEAQVFCVTHLPQVAACGHHHFQVNKTKSSDKTTTSLKTLKADQRVDEIARMLGGKTITEQTRRHAEEMLELLTR